MIILNDDIPSRLASIQAPDGPVRINYIDTGANSGNNGTLLLIHGFPQTSYQFHLVAPLLSAAGYRVIVRDYRSAGRSSKSPGGYTKSCMAQDLHQLATEHLKITGKLHVVGHDIGGMIAYVYAAQQPEHVASLIWDECPLLGTSTYEEDQEIAETLVQGKEELYLQHFYDKLSFNSDGITKEDVAVYAESYRKPGAMRAAFKTYQIFEKDKEENLKAVKMEGKIKCPSLVLSEEMSRHAQKAKSMANEMCENNNVSVMKDAGHYIAEENPEDFVRLVLESIGKYEGIR